MKNINRKTFLKQAAGIGAWMAFNPLTSFGKNQNIFNSEFKNPDIYERVLAANTKVVTRLVNVLQSDITELKRDLGFDFANLVSAYSEPLSPFYQKADLIPLMEKIIKYLSKEQQPDGTLNIANLASPPDTAFIMEPICAATAVLNKNNAPALNDLKTILKQFILKAGDGLTEGGIHTPNHRWVISAALAQINDLYPNKKYVNRIDEWLSETVFIDSEGHYLERSMIYSEVIDRALITIARLLKRPALYEPVRKNLDMAYYYLEPNGDLVTVDSRRQDQFIGRNVFPYYIDYRFMAINDNNGQYAAIAQFIENLKGFDEDVLSQAMFWFLEEPLFKKPLPTLTQPPARYEKFFKETNLVRFRRDSQTATIFGGADWPLIIASGRSSNPNFFSFRKGDAILKHIRLSTDFFSTGYFRSKGVKKEGDKYVLNQKTDVPYYQPLPPDKRRKDGDYKHSESIDGRFWNKMDFENRPVSNVKTLDSKITVQELKTGGFEINFDIGGVSEVNVTIELCFKEGGILSNVTTFDDTPDNYFLAKGSGTYQMGKDTITFGNGALTHHKLRAIDGEVYTSHYGTLRTTGMHVYLTGKTPFKHTITIG